MKKSYKQIMNEVYQANNEKTISGDQVNLLRENLLLSYKNIFDKCDENGIRPILCGGSALGAVRHGGFIPWDDDFDIAMSRRDFEKFKQIFKKELSDKYILEAPNYSDIVKTRMPKIYIKNVFVSYCGKEEPENLNIDLFIIENIPDNKIIRSGRGFLAMALMYIIGQVQSYENQSEYLKKYWSKTIEGEKVYKKRVKKGKIFSFLDAKQWICLLDRVCHYDKESEYVSIPTGRKHYFGEIMKKDVFFPPIETLFDECRAYIPNKVDDYLNNLYGDYMVVPKNEDREKHYIKSIDIR